MNAYSSKDIEVPDNVMKLQFSSKSENESFARVAVSAFVAQLDPTLEQLTEIKTAVSEAVTNAIIHGYDGRDGEVRLTCSLWPGVVEITVEDDGCGIEDIEQARQPLYTTKPELERSGMGLTIMENFVDELYIDSSPQHGTRIRMRKAVASVPNHQ